MSQEAGPRLPDVLSRFLHLGGTALPVRHEATPPTDNARAKRIGNKLLALAIGFGAFNVGGAAGAIVSGGVLLVGAGAGAAAGIYAYHRIRRN